jgi:hypothetical protein
MMLSYFGFKGVGAFYGLINRIQIAKLDFCFDIDKLLNKFYGGVLDKKYKQIIRNNLVLILNKSIDTK